MFFCTGWHHFFYNTRISSNKEKCQNDCREIGNSGNSAKPEIEDVFAQQVKPPVFVEEVEARREEIVEQVDAIVSGE